MHRSLPCLTQENTVVPCRVVASGAGLDLIIDEVYIAWISLVADVGSEATKSAFGSDFYTRVIHPNLAPRSYILIVHHIPSIHPDQSLIYLTLSSIRQH